jgi:hypothetical protein
MRNEATAQTSPKARRTAYRLCSSRSWSKALVAFGRMTKNSSSFRSFVWEDVLERDGHPSCVAFRKTKGPEGLPSGPPFHNLSSVGGLAVPRRARRWATRPRTRSRGRLRGAPAADAR